MTDWVLDAAVERVPAWAWAPLFALSLAASAAVATVSVRLAAAAVRRLLEGRGDVWR